MRNSLPVILGMLLPILVRAEEILVEPTPLTLATAMARSLENVRTVQANVSTRTATVARFEALKHFIPMASLPQLVVGLNNVAGRASSNSIFPM